MNTQLLRVLQDADVHEEYDVLFVDPPATEGRHLYNAVAATRSLVIPVEPSAKGQQSVKGLENLVQGLKEELDIEVGVWPRSRSVSKTPATNKTSSPTSNTAHQSS